MIAEYERALSTVLTRCTAAGRRFAGLPLAVAGRGGEKSRSFGVSLVLFTLSTSGCESSPPLDSGPVLPPEFATLSDEALLARCHVSTITRVESDSPPIASIRGADYNARLGFLLVDQYENVVFLFAPDGTYRRTYGRPGSGPGELRAATDAVFLPGDSIAVLDRFAGIVVYAPDGKYLRSSGPRPEIEGGLSMATDGVRLYVGVLSRSPTQAPHVTLVDPTSFAVLGEVEGAPPAREYGTQYRQDIRIATREVSGSMALVTAYHPGFATASLGQSAIPQWHVLEAPGWIRHKRPPRFRSQGDMVRWARSGSHMVGVALPDDSTLLVQWDAEVDGLRELRLATVRGGVAVSVVRTIFTLVRARSDTIVFLDRSSEPVYRVLVCRGWR